MSFAVELIGIGVITAGLSAALALGSQRLARRFGAMDMPDGKHKQHRGPVPLLGGLGILLTFLLVVGLSWSQGLFVDSSISAFQWLGFLLACVLIEITGEIDDVRGLSPRVRFGLYILACALVILSGTSVRLITSWQPGQAVSLVWWMWHGLSFPADVLTLGWLLSVLFATKLLDGVDGLVSGQSVIGGGMILLLTLTPSFYQPAVAVLAVIFLASFLGFLPWNWPRARQFLGESGSVFAGFGLGVLAIISGAKLATAFMVLGMPMIDIVFVVLGRWKRGQSMWKGDRTHLHHRLMDAGFTSRQVTVMLWLLMTFFGGMSFLLAPRGKVVLMLLLILTTLGLSAWARRRAMARVV